MKLSEVKSGQRFAAETSTFDIGRSLPIEQRFAQLQAAVQQLNDVFAFMSETARVRFRLKIYNIPDRMCNPDGDLPFFRLLVTPIVPETLPETVNLAEDVVTKE